jgi:Na+:H+ antiporter, NhaA family
VQLAWLAGGLGCAVLVVVLRRADVVYPPAYVAVGLAMWLCAHESGVHATLAGVVMGLLAPVAVCEQLVPRLHPWSSYVVLPVFALANAGLELTADRATAFEPVTVGVLVGLVVGKVVGVSGAAWLAARTGVGQLPRGTTWPQVVGAASLAGIGFTVSIFVTGLAFDDPALQADAKIGILVASVLAAVLGSAILVVAGRRGAAQDS